MDEGTKEDSDLQIRGDPVIQTLRLGGGGRSQSVPLGDRRLRVVSGRTRFKS